MRNTITLFLCTLFAGFVQAQLLPYVNPFVGTGGHGHTFPGATAPFGMVQLSPDTRIDPMDWDGCSGYHYSDSLIYGFSHTHLSGTGVADYADILMFPFHSGVRIEPEEYAQPFRKDTEKAEAGYYSVLLERDQIKCELTASDRVGLHRYSFPKYVEKGKVMLDLRHRDEVLDAHFEVVGPREIAGYRISKSWGKEQHVYFVARFSKRISSSIVLDMSKNPREALPSVTSKSIIALIDFNVGSEPLVAAVAISGVSIEGARKNLDAECKDLDFDRIKKTTQLKWEQQLSKIQVEGGTPEQRSTFYTALYHTMIAPNIWNDVDGRYRGRDNQIHQTQGHDMYTVFSLWDTYRAANPLYTIIEPRRTGDFIQTFLRQYEQGGLLPIWELAANETDCMIGNHAIPVIADAWAKGIRNYDLNLALQAAEKSAMQDRLGLEAYRKLGYVPAERESESVSKTLEYAYDDWCIAQLAQAAGKEKLQQQFNQRAQYYKNLFDPSSGFFRAKNNASWHSPFDPFEVNFNYTEANAWQYRFAVPQDLNGLMRLMGGKEVFLANLDTLFGSRPHTTGRNQADITGLIGQYVQGNEPSHHMAYLYNYAGQPHKTQQRVRQILDEQYFNRPDGLSGNEDCGQMSAWYVLSAMGFYQVCPGDPTYTFGTPLFDKVSIQLGNGKTFVIQAKGAAKKRPYIKRITEGEKEWSKMWFTHDMLLQGASFNLEMAELPATWGAASRDCPVSELRAEAIVPVPFVQKGQRAFRGKQHIELGCIDPEAQIYYTLSDPNGPDQPLKTLLYKKPFLLDKSAQIQCWAEKGGRKSPVAQAYFSRIPEGMRVEKYNTQYNPQYTGRGEDCLIDGLWGQGNDFRTGDWQGFEGQNLDVVVDLGKNKSIEQLSAHFLQDENAWIFFPSKVRFEASEDGKNFKALGDVSCDVPTTQTGGMAKNFSLKVPKQKARYVRIVGESLIQCPDWHKGKGYKCWVFSDEITIK